MDTNIPVAIHISSSINSQQSIALRRKGTITEETHKYSDACHSANMLLTALYK